MADSLRSDSAATEWGPTPGRALGVTPALRDTCVVIPAYNEARVIRRVVQEVLATGTGHAVVVDDCSTDDTAAVLRGVACTILRHRINLGQGAALQTGIEHAVRQGARYVVTFDADGQHDPHDIARFVGELEKGDVDIVLGSRFLGRAEGMDRRRKILLKGALLFTRVTTGRMPLTDVHNGLRAFRAEVAPWLVITQNRMAHASELLTLIHAGQLRYRELPNTVRYTPYSKAKGQSALGAIDIVYELLVRRLLLR
jgi:glycosyltransferase involved in cell wall biosynthesis